MYQLPTTTLTNVMVPWLGGLMTRLKVGPRDVQSGNKEATKPIVRSSPLGMKRLTLTGFGIVMVSAGPSCAIDGGAQRNANKYIEQRWRMVPLIGVFVIPGGRQPECPYSSFVMEQPPLVHLTTIGEGRATSAVGLAPNQHVEMG
jgi:hypothetical protein